MFSDNPSILQLVALLKAHGVRHIVACPGSRNAPIIHSLTNDSFFTLHPVTDERSAGFFALGVALAQGDAVAVCCTSGTALLNLHPAVAEAFYQKVPLVVISADRPAAWIGQQDGQTLPQPNVFGSLVKMSVTLPEGNSPENCWHRNRLINEALLETHHHGRGPVHINIPLGEPLFAYHTEQLPRERVIRRLAIHDHDYELNLSRLLCRIEEYPKRLIVAGQHPSVFVGNVDFVCLGEFASNVVQPPKTIENADLLLAVATEEEKEQLVPDLLITFGGHIVSKRVKQFFRQHPPREHWHVSEDGAVIDTFQCLNQVIEANPWQFLEAVNKKHLFYEANLLPIDDYEDLWLSLSKRIKKPKFPFSGMAAVGALLNHFPDKSVLHLANSSAVRYAQLFPFQEKLPRRFARVIRRQALTMCNRGTSGIEGSLSSAIGFAKSDKLSKFHFLVIGDLSFFYDMNALCIEPFPQNLRILLLNNGGGGIFHHIGMPLTPETEPLIAAKHPVTSAKAWAEQRSLTYLCATNNASLKKAITLFTQEESCPMLLEVMTDAESDHQLLNDYYNFQAAQAHS